MLTIGLETYLEHRHEEPNEESFHRKGAAFLKCSVKGRILHTRLNTDILIENQREDRHRCVNRSVTKDQSTVVHGNGNEVENNAENCLDNCYDKASVNDKLT